MTTKTATVVKAAKGSPVINVTSSGKPLEINISRITGIKRGLLRSGAEITVADWNKGSEEVIAVREDVSEVFQQVFMHSPRGLFIDSVTFENIVAD